MNVAYLDIKYDVFIKIELGNYSEGELKELT